MITDPHHSPLQELAERMRPALQDQLRSIVDHAIGPGMDELHTMLAYQMGWVGEGAGPQAQGKQIRPLLVLLAAQAGGGNWKDALPAAGAVELLHNFSLIHDDIQDDSPTRRGRPSVWKKWGRAQAINTGDAMYTLAYRSLHQLNNTFSPQIVLRAYHIFNQTCFRLTEGQHLDLNFEDREEITLDEYWAMVQRKTAALLGAGLEIGALCAGVSESRRHAFREFGRHLGLAFQALDDILGIWGEKEVMGKSNQSDLLTGKKTLPILYGIAQKGDFYTEWRGGEITPRTVSRLAKLLEKEGARCFASEKAASLTETALKNLEQAQPGGKAGVAIRDLATQLLQRKG